MHLLRETGCAFFLLLLFTTSMQATATVEPGMKVWAIGDYVRIDPLSGKAFEVNLSLFPESLTGNYAQKNLVWDGATKTISLKAARNETTAFQIIVERVGDSKLTGVNVKLGKLVGPGAKAIPVENVDLFKEWYVPVKKRSDQNYSLGTGWYPDGLVPCLRWTGKRFAQAIRAADALLITAGAGMGVDSGLPEFCRSTGI